MPITTLPEAPSRSTPATFSDLADALLGALETFVTEANALETNVNAKEVLAVAAAVAAEASEAVAMAAANYVGPWADQVGAAAVPYAVSHLDQYWQLSENLADVTAKTPGTDAEWIRIGWTVKTMQEAVYAADAEASDTYVITLSPVPAAYFAGMMITFKANTANTGACTIDVNELGAKSIKKQLDQSLADGDIKAGQLVALIYDGTNFQMLSQLGAETATLAIGSVGGGAQALDLSRARNFTMTIDTAETTISFTNPPASPTLCVFSLWMTNLGSQTTNWPAALHTATGGALPTPTASGIDLWVVATTNGGTSYTLIGYVLDFQAAA